MNDGGPAFPMFFDGTPQRSVLHGLSIRDYFAAAALTGLCAGIADYRPSLILDHDAFAEEAFSIADAMLAERGK